MSVLTSKLDFSKIFLNKQEIFKKIIQNLKILYYEQK